jgi:hypothetical protein
MTSSSAIIHRSMLRVSLAHRKSTQHHENPGSTRVSSLDMFETKITETLERGGREGLNVSRLTPTHDRPQPLKMNRTNR